LPDPEPRPPDERLATIAGQWRTSGHVIGEPKTSVTGTDIYEVLSGGQSMTALWERSDDGISWHRWMDIQFTPADHDPG
jgi:hypothetical protein